MPVGDLQLGLAQRELLSGGVAAGSQVELPPVPRANDVLGSGVVLEHARLAVRVDRLENPLIDAALAHRPAAMCALIIPGDEFAIDHEHADLGAVAGYDPSLAVREFPDAPYHKGFHSLTCT